MLYFVETRTLITSLFLYNSWIKLVGHLIYICRKVLKNEV